MSVFSRLKNYFHQRVRRKPQVFIMPTVAGLWWLGSVFLLMLMGWGYANNLCLALAVLLLSLSVIFLIECHFNLEGLRVQRISFEDQFQGAPSSWRAQLKDLTQRSRKDLWLRWDGPQKIQGEMRLLSVQSAEGELSFPRTGRWRSPTLILESSYPLGLFRAWSFQKCESEVWVYPAPLARGVRLDQYHQDDSQTERYKVSTSGDEPHESKVFEPSDPYNRIDWKQFAKNRELRVRTYQETQTSVFYYQWPYLSGDELSCRKLVGLIEEHYARVEKFGFKSSGLELPPQCDPYHRQKVLRSLTESIS
jgi:uncharacterized protein (DUF58 family)